MPLCPNFSGEKPAFVTVLGRGLLFLLVVSVLSMLLNIVVVWVCRLLVCIPGALSGRIPLGECLNPVEEVCAPGIAPSWQGCRVAWEDRPGAK